MLTLGPFYFNPLTTTNGFPTSQQIGVITGTGSLIEIINQQVWPILVAFPNAGQVFQEGRSKCIYLIQQGTQGTQTITISTFANSNFLQAQGNVLPGTFTRNPPYLQNGISANLPVWINVYQAGEMQWYPPVALSPAIPTIQFMSKSGNATYTMILPNTATAYGQPTVNGTCDLLGFDATCTVASAASIVSITITNLALQPDGSNSLSYILHQLPTGAASIVEPLSIRFPAPISNFNGQITFTVSISASNPTVDLNAYYSLL